MACWGVIMIGFVVIYLQDAGDFTQWKDHDAYSAFFKCPLRDLNDAVRKG